MSFYENQSWSAPGRPASWDQQLPPSRAGSSATGLPDDGVAAAFSGQFEEVERAIDNLIKSGKLFPAAGRRDSMPIIGPARPFPEYDARAGPSIQRHHSLTELDPMRPPSGTNLQSYYANQRFQHRPSEAEQMLQQNRRVAAQREREMRNYHQEQQYNRSTSTVVPAAAAAAATKTDD
ncbi:MAG: hypothetical protein M1826_005433 [Phylliscum demangeonii]|nr:MAG: hypothetical protein M1826_005433 [Phylliscum demangeonii]